MNNKYFGWVLILLVAGILSPLEKDGVQASHMGTPGEDPHRKDRPLYVYPGNYREEVNRLKDRFQQAYGYALMDLDEEWRPEEIEKLHAAFARLPENFYRIVGLKGFYRAGRLQVKNQGPAAPEIPDAGGIPAATFPRFTSVYRHVHQSYQVMLADEPLRIEFYNPVFYESPEDFSNIVHHEMAHVYDLAHGFLTFQNEWLSLSGFRILHLPALDGKLDSDFLYTLVSDPGILNYGPVSGRHLPTYSRENPQEDFANSVAAYIHYPYFQYTHPKRHRYLKEHVFQGKEYFKEMAGDYVSIIRDQIEQVLAGRNWERMMPLVREQSRVLNERVETQWVKALREAIGQKISGEADLQLAIASCYLMHPKAQALRMDLLAARRIQLARVFRDSRCWRMGAQSFEGDQAHWSMMHLHFYREENAAMVQFLDPAALTAHARGYETRYRWRLSITSPRSRLISQGESAGSQPPNGAFKIDLETTAKGRYVMPEGRKLILEVSALRVHPQILKTLESPWTPIQFVVQPGFKYLGPSPASFQIVFPPSWKTKE